jgi:hypothetical protein
MRDEHARAETEIEVRDLAEVLAEALASPGSFTRP